MNGQKQLLTYGGSIVGVAAFLTAFTVIINLFIGPLEKSLNEWKAEVRDARAQDRADVASLRAELKRIGDLAAERGIEIPRVRADIARIEADNKIAIGRIETELTRMRDHLDRIEQGLRPKGP